MKQNTSRSFFKSFLEQYTYRDAPKLVLFAFIYFIVAKLSLSLATIHASASPVWPPTGLALGALLIFGYRFWPAVWFGAFIANQVTAGSLITSFAIASGNTLEALIGAYLVNRFAAGLHAFERPRNVFKFCILAGGLSAMVSPLIGASSLAIFGFAEVSEFGLVWLTWWLGDAGGALTAAPFLIMWSMKNRIRYNAKQTLEVLVLIFTFLLVSGVVFGNLIPAIQSRYPIAFTLLPIFLWAAFRFSKREVATLIFLLAMISAYGTTQGLGPFGIGNQNESLLVLQGFTIFMSVSALALVTTVAKWKEYEDVLRESEERFNIIFETELFGITLVHPHTLQFIETNTAFSRITGYSKEELKRLSLSDITHPDDLPKSMGLSYRLLRAEAPHGKITKRYITKDKKTIDVRLFASAIHNKDGKTIYYLHIIEPIPAHQRRITDQVPS